MANDYGSGYCAAYFFVCVAIGVNCITINDAMRNVPWLSIKLQVCKQLTSGFKHNNFTQNVT